MSADVQISLRFRSDDPLLKQIDRYLEILRESTPGIDYARTDAVKAVLARGFKAADKDRR